MARGLDMDAYLRAIEPHETFARITCDGLTITVHEGEGMRWQATFARGSGVRSERLPHTVTTARTAMEEAIRLLAS